jgi:hypothetical protein
MQEPSASTASEKTDAFCFENAHFPLGGWNTKAQAGMDDAPPVLCCAVLYCTVTAPVVRHAG